MSGHTVTHIVPKHELDGHSTSVLQPCLCAPVVVEMPVADIDGSPFIGALLYYHSALDGTDLQWDAEFH